MYEYAVTIIGTDRPGIIADVSEILAGLGLNLTDSTMTRLRGYFAMTLVCAGRVSGPEIDVALKPLTTDGSLIAMIRNVEAEHSMVSEGDHYVLTVHGADRLGIVAELTREVARVGGNITDLTTRLVDHLYVVVAEVDFLHGVNLEDLEVRIADVSARLGVEATLRASEADVL